MMRLRLGILYSVVILCTLTMNIVSSRNVQEPTPTYIPIEPVLSVAFPRLECNSIEPPYTGPTWNGIAVGSSSLDELRDFVRELSPEYSEHSNPSLKNKIEFSIRSAVADAEGIPALIEVCVDSDDETITAIYITPISPQIGIDDMVIDYGVPDLVVWDSGLESRVVIWLTKGIAASVSVNDSEQFVPYGTIRLKVYFPYQSLEGYEERWPYTHQASSKAELVTLTPELPHVTNPFDFNAMIATITAESSRTPTPTLELRSTATATP